LRYDQLMDIGWKRLIPLSLGWLLIVAGFVIDGWWGLAMAATVVVAAIAITRAFVIGAEREEESGALIPAVGVRLWSRPHAPTSPSSEGGDRG
jgi:NADH-quinone oxidoreductase subunit H